MAEHQVRHPAATGSFYPADPGMLRKEIRGYLDQVQSAGLKNIQGLVAPHAGYVYSGQVAAHAYKQIERADYESVLVIAPSHAETFHFISLYPGGYRTPLGTASPDRKNAQKLAENKWIRFSEQGHRNEHSLEVQIPFLQVVLGDVPMVFAVMGNQSPELVRVLSQEIANNYKQNHVLIVASSDLSHYHPYDRALSLDGEVENLIDHYDHQGLADRFFSQDIEMCGAGPVVAAMGAAQKLGSKHARVLDYKNSGDITGDRSAVVGYLAAVLY